MSLYKKIKNFSLHPENISEEIWQLFENVIDICNNTNGIIYGGFLRDLILGEYPSDLDIMFQKNVKNIKTFIELLGKKYEFIKIDEKNSPEYDHHVRKVCVKLDKEFMIDIHYSANIDVVDFDVNSLFIFNNKFSSFVCNFSVENISIKVNVKKKKLKEIIKSIYDKECEMITHDTRRLNKMRSKKWKIKET